MSDKITQSEYDRQMKEKDEILIRLAVNIGYLACKIGQPLEEAIVETLTNFNIKVKQ